MIQERQSIKVACLEEIALIKGWITKKELLKETEDLKKTSYGNYLIDLMENMQ